MKAKKSVVLISIILIVSLLMVAFSGCDKPESGIHYNDKVEGRYSDGMKIIEETDAPTTAIEYTDTSRVTKVMYVDNRVKGLHFTALYLPKGETVSVTVGTNIISQNHKLVINSNEETQKIIDINSSSITYTAEDKGARIDVYVNNTNAEYNAFEIKFSGCVEMPYYRLGVDKHEVIDNDGYAVLDCANARFIIPADVLNEIHDIEASLNWWRSSIEIMNRITDAGLESGDLAPIIVYVSEKYTTNTFEETEKCIKMSVSSFTNMMHYDKLSNGSGEVLLNLFGELIASRANGYDIGMLQKDFGKVLSDLSYIVMTDNIKPIDTVNKANASEYLKSIKDGTCQDSKAEIFFNTILQSFGLKSTIEVLKQYKYTMQTAQDGKQIEEYVVDVCEILDRDVTDFVEFLGYTLHEDIKTQCNKYPNFIPTQTALTTTGSGEPIYQTGVVLPLGQINKIDFNEAIVSLKDGWVVENLTGSDCWNQIESGVYNYTPSKDKLEDFFSIVLVNGEDRVTLNGKISVNIKVTTNSIYNNVAFKDIDKAIKETKEIAPDEVFSVYKAQVIPENITKENSYSLSKANGSIQIKESGNYTLYLKSKGLVKVKFGVPEYMFDMFSNQLPVVDYIDELKYEIELDSSKIYNFEIYVLSTKGDGWATLGIKDEAGNIVDIDEDYIVYQDMPRSKIVEYKSPVIDIDSFKVQQKGYENHSTRNWKLIKKFNLIEGSKESNLFDNNKTTYFETNEASKEFILTVDMVQPISSDYIQICNKIEMVGTNLKIEGSSDNENYELIYDGKINEVENTITFKDQARIIKYVRITLSKDEPFNCYLSEISLGRIMKESYIIPNTSTKIRYQGEWHEVKDYASVNGSLTVNNDKNSTIEYEFYGTMINVYATKAPEFGIVRIYIDNKEMADINLQETTATCGVKIYSKEFDEIGLHKIKLVPVGKDDFINLDYLTSIEKERPKAEANKFNYWYMIIIPVVLVLALIGFAIADGCNKKDKKKVKIDNKENSETEDVENTDK